EQRRNLIDNYKSNRKQNNENIERDSISVALSQTS
ncbi:unnamed protein product, partial [Rotaria sordida]